MPEEKSVRSEPLGDDGERVEQQNMAGMDNIDGGGEFPDPDTPPDEAAGAPGDLVPHRQHGQGQFNDVQPAVGAAPEGAQEDSVSSD